MASIDRQFEFAELIALFLAEVIRSRRTSLRRAAEISRHVVLEIKGINGEEDALRMLTNIEKDFEEVATLKQALHFGYGKSSIKVFEGEIKEYASRVFVTDMVMSSEFLQDAAKSGMTIQELCLKYPEFCNFVYTASDKAGLIASARQAMTSGA